METSSITVEKMQVVNGKAVPTGEYETLEADSLILALGQEADTDFLKHIEGITFKEDGTTVEVNPSMMTGYPEFLQEEIWFLVKERLPLQQDTVKSSQKY